MVQAFVIISQVWKLFIWSPFIAIFYWRSLWSKSLYNRRRGCLFLSVNVKKAWTNLLFFWESRKTNFVHKKDIFYTSWKIRISHFDDLSLVPKWLYGFKIKSVIMFLSLTIFLSDFHDHIRTLTKCLLYVIIDIITRKINLNHFRQKNFETLKLFSNLFLE